MTRQEAKELVQAHNVEADRIAVVGIVIYCDPTDEFLDTFAQEVIIVKGDEYVKKEKVVPSKKAKEEKE